jgi:hypothetical protein
LPTKAPRAEAVTRRDLRLVAVGGSTAPQAPSSDRTPTWRPPAPRTDRELANDSPDERSGEEVSPAARQSSVRLRGTDEERWAYALVDVVTADFSKDPRYEE